MVAVCLNNKRYIITFDWGRRYSQVQFLLIQLLKHIISSYLMVKFPTLISSPFFQLRWLIKSTKICLDSSGSWETHNMLSHLTLKKKPRLKLRHSLFHYFLVTLSQLRMVININPEICSEPSGSRKTDSILSEAKINPSLWEHHIHVVEVLRNGFPTFMTHCSMYSGLTS
jgi:hypothetical protein